MKTNQIQKIFSNSPQKVKNGSGYLLYNVHKGD